MNLLSRYPGLFAATLALPLSLSGLPVAADESTEEANKQLVITAYQALFGDHDMTALETYFREDYIQHNPSAETGREGLRRFLEGSGITAAPKSTLEFLRVAADGDLVWLYSAPNYGQGQMAVVDIFRVQDGMIAEHWDVMQPVPETTVSGNSMTGELK